MNYGIVHCKISNMLLVFTYYNPFYILSWIKNCVIIFKGKYHTLIDNDEVGMALENTQDNFLVFTPSRVEKIIFFIWHAYMEEVTISCCPEFHILKKLLRYH